MSSTYSSNLRVELIRTGDQAGTWGTTTDNNFAYIFDSAIAGYQAVTVFFDQSGADIRQRAIFYRCFESVCVRHPLKFNSAAAASNIYAPPASRAVHPVEQHQLHHHHLQLNGDW
jgi:hypothetical protein